MEDGRQLVGQIEQHIMVPQSAVKLKLRKIISLTFYHDDSMSDYAISYQAFLCTPCWFGDPVSLHSVLCVRHPGRLLNIKVLHGSFQEQQGMNSSDGCRNAKCKLEISSKS